MQLNLSWYGNRKVCLKEATDFLDAQVFKFPEYQVLIAGVRGSIVGQLQGVSDDAQGSITGVVSSDGSLIRCELSIEFNGVSK